MCGHSRPVVQGEYDSIDVRGEKFGGVLELDEPFIQALNVRRRRYQAELGEVIDLASAQGPESLGARLGKRWLRFATPEFLDVVYHLFDVVRDIVEVQIGTEMFEITSKPRDAFVEYVGANLGDALERLDQWLDSCERELPVCATDERGP